MESIETLNSGVKGNYFHMMSLGPLWVEASVRRVSRRRAWPPPHTQTPATVKAPPELTSEQREWFGANASLRGWEHREPRKKTRGRQRVTTDPRRAWTGDLSDSKVAKHREGYSAPQGPCQWTPGMGPAWHCHGACVPFKQGALDLNRMFCIQTSDQC